MANVNSLTATRHPSSKASLNWAPVFVMGLSIFCWATIIIPLVRVFGR